jgi:Protein of unknown function (DUF3107)
MVAAQRWLRSEPPARGTPDIVPNARRGADGAVPARERKGVEAGDLALVGDRTTQGGIHVEVRIGIVQTMKELEVELPEDAERDAVIADVEEALAKDAVLWLTDRRGRRVGVPSSRVAYVEVGADAGERRVGFGNP